MSLNNKPLETINEYALQALLDNGVAEGKTIDYKEALPGNSDSEKKEFLYDVSSFANASGGHLIFGIKEDGGIPIAINGLDVPDVDAVILKLDNIIRDGISPRIPGLIIRTIYLQNDRVVIVIRIPRSFAQPHRIIFSKDSRFYSRNSAGKYPLDVGELRTAFTLSQNTFDRIRSFRQERLSMIVSDETPISMISGAKLVLHIIPIGAFEPASNFDIIDIVAIYESSPSLFEPLDGDYYYSNGWKRRYNYDGYLTFIPQSQNVFTHSYLQVFRNGIIEAVNVADLIGVYKHGKGVIFKEYEKSIFQGLSRFLEIQSNLGVELPLFIMLSMLSVKDYIMGYDPGYGRSYGSPIDRETLIIPEIMIEDLSCNLPQVMKPIFDTVWNAAGYPRSLNYDEDGNWQAR